MAESRFWKIVAVLLLVGVFYVGHGLHQSGNLPTLPAFISQARANGIATQEMHYQTGGAISIAVTCSPDGKRVYFFGPKEFQDNFRSQAYLATLTAP